MEHSQEQMPPSEDTVAQDKSPPKREPSAAFLEFEKKLNEEAAVENKIRLALDFMRAALSQAGTPRFRDFWEGRRVCLPLFKETLHAKSRTQFWNEYVELSNEAKRIKELLDEQSSFAIEQIELAIQALERDLEHYDLLISQVPEIVFSESCLTIEPKKGTYNALQKELSFLNVLASRLNSLRKEIVKTEMRIRIKNKLLAKLSVLGDKIFPRRKELIRQISQEFIEDVKSFVAAYFDGTEQKDLPPFVLREEIKGFQALAKLLTLNTHAFTQTRSLLSECWDKLKSREKEKKKEFTEKKLVYKQNFDQVVEKIKPYSEACKGEISQDAVNKGFDEILAFMKSVELGRDEVRVLKDELHHARKPFLDKQREKEALREQQIIDLEKKKREKAQHLRSQLDQLLHGDEAMSAEQVEEKREQLAREMETLVFTKAEKQIIDRLFKQVKDLVDEKKEKALMNLSEADLQNLSELKALLDERKQRRQELRDQLEVYRKALGGSGFDFEKAMMYRELIEAEKASLEKVNSAIEEIEAKIDEIEEG